MTITAIPPLDRTSPTFRTEVDTYFATSIPTFTTEINALATDLTTKQGIASGAATTATTAAGTATTKAGEALTSAGNAATSAGNAATSEANAAASAATIGTAAAFLDSNPIVKGSADISKQVRIEVDGITTGQTRAWTAQDVNGTVAFLHDTGVTLVWPPVTPTAVSYIDLLFSATYDNYEIVVDSISHSGASTETLQMRLLVAGVADATAKYSSLEGGTVGASAPVYTSSGTLIPAAASISSFATAGLSATIKVFGTNETTRPKIVIADALFINGSGYLDARGYSTHYIGTTAVTGIRLFWGSGAPLFNASGKIRIFGYKNS
ncbi:hypothetical protein CR152_27935 [Massilia violaceinigra]|uniref:Uncharacterized protein n=1 Tax=Massilia violaceinigra TaxID=2045208 RepID=A0A2D2DSI0_9BURK|nr:hypothetical protein [Massilia violaceinigra]ATQ77906.1 hypothetical protein CR152_27935 [Massilia violaceinigra]